MSFTKNDQAVVLNRESLQYLANCIRLVHSLPDLLNDVLPSQTTTYSSYKVTELLNTLNTDLQNYVNNALGNLSHLKKEIVSVAPTDSSADEDTIYLVQDASGGYEQYLKINGVVTSLGSTSAINNVYTKTESDSKFGLLSTLNSLITAVGGLNDLTTTDKTSIVNAINELKTSLTSITTHTNDTDIHVTTAERTKWNGKVDKDSILSNLNSSPTAEQVYNASFVNNIIKNSSYYYNANTNRTDIKERKKAIQYVINKLNGIYSVNNIPILGDGNVNIPSTVFTIRYSGGYYYTYIVSNVYSAINILEYCPYEYSLNVWRESGNDLIIGAWSQIFNNKDNKTISNAFSDETYYKLISLSYSIRNGICYMKVQVKCITPYTGSTNYCDVSTINALTIPTPEIASYKLLFDIGSNTGCSFYIGSSAVQMKGGKAGTVYMGEFSYPIKIKYK